jgi:A/G-specific adenine glycosylase
MTGPVNRDPSSLRGLELAADRLVRWYRQNARDLPWRHAKDPYAVWISEVMLQQTRVEVVVGRYERFLRRFPDLLSLARASESDVLAEWAGLGYYRRARQLHQTARHLVAREGAQLPQSEAALRLLPGFGPYTAGAVASIAFGEAVPAVDGNVERVLARL